MAVLRISIFAAQMHRFLLASPDLLPPKTEAGSNPQRLIPE